MAHMVTTMAILLFSLLAIGHCRLLEADPSIEHDEQVLHKPAAAQHASAAELVPTNLRFSAGQRFLRLSSSRAPPPPWSQRYHGHEEEAEATSRFHIHHGLRYRAPPPPSSHLHIHEEADDGKELDKEGAGAVMTPMSRAHVRHGLRFRAPPPPSSSKSHLHDEKDVGQEELDKERVAAMVRFHHFRGPPPPLSRSHQHYVEEAKEEEGGVMKWFMDLLNLF